MVRGIRNLLLACLMIAALNVPMAQAQGNPADEVFRLVNAFRANYGLPPFTYNAQLAAAAQLHADYIARNNLYSHYWPNGSGPQQRAEVSGYLGWAGENYVAGTNLSPQQGVTWWSNSPVHFANMVSQRHSEGAVAYAYGNDQNWYVLVIGQPISGLPEGYRPARQSDVNAYVAPIDISPPREDGSIVHKVLQGHTVWAIAARYGVSVADIYLFNALDEDSFISPGDELTIRLADGQAPPPTPTPHPFHTVQEGESLWSIAAWEKIDLATLLYLNGLNEDSVVHPGNEIRIRLLPGESPPPTPTPKLTHKVVSGDTAWGVAIQYGLTLDQLALYNNMNPDAFLQIGQELLIRPPTETPTATPPPTETPTLAPEVVSLPTVTPQPSATATLAAAAATEAPTPTEPEVPANALGIGTLVAGLSLTLLAGVGILVVLRKGK